ncbi:Chaperone for flagella basal body P-ring formation [Bifidobacterium commune]|uniref:Chaperone for flagella basal body P-ring formation n=1 Tax=Bifidobacterium commune TaxID=1505727 RepID=A0A1C4H547_9BIFI|nr:SAF domain-containing protein [Bifidobacterium commune]SCC79852.1 Chaperone for flagella basal body P-ring formation [Bifidobacterium commune]
MKTIFSHLGKQTPTLKQRRNMRQIRTVLGALCAGLAVFFALQSIAGTLSTKSAVTATHNISRGHTISISDTKQVQIPESPALSAVFSSDEEAKGLVAQVDIAAGSVIMQSMVRPTPMITHGETVIDVRMSGSHTSLIPGDKVSLVGSAGCESVPNPIVQQPDQRPDQDSNADPADAGTDEYPPNDVSNDNRDTPDSRSVPMESTGQTCTLAPKATVTGNSQRDSGGVTTLQLAMPPQDASRVMAVQDRMPIMAAKL